jgi:hypothetical protein
MGLLEVLWGILLVVFFFFTFGFGIVGSSLFLLENLVSFVTRGFLDRIPLSLCIFLIYVCSCM